MLTLPADQTEVSMTPEDRERAIEASMRVTTSPHEWEWTPEEQALMARFVLWSLQRLYMCERIAAGDPWEVK